jgi:2-amino-4-hydroxy-6-hydroxymethyldihydropteridine diphosphokinase
MTRVVLSVGSNLGDRLARLQSVVDGLAEAPGTSVVAISPVYETAPWGVTEQGPFLNAVVIADDAASDGRSWLGRAQQFEQAADRVREQRWGPRTLDVDLVACHDDRAEVILRAPELTLPHPLAHLRAFVLMPWLDVEPDAELTLVEGRRPVVELLAELEPAERAGVRLTEWTLA